MTPVAGAVKEMADGTADGGTAPAAGVGSWSTALGSRTDAAHSAVSSLMSELDPARLTGVDATRLYESMVAIERLTLAGKTLLARRIETSGAWREGGTVRRR
jgi:hypothetical protein